MATKRALWEGLYRYTYIYHYADKKEMPIKRLLAPLLPHVKIDVHLRKV